MNLNSATFPREGGAGLQGIMDSHTKMSTSLGEGGKAGDQAPKSSHYSRRELLSPDSQAFQKLEPFQSALQTQGGPQ